MPRQKVIWLALAWHESDHMEGIIRYAHEAGWAIRRSVTRDGDGAHRPPPDGIICQLHSAYAALNEVVRSHRVPKVSLANCLPGMTMPMVLPDLRAEGRMAAMHLCERGLTNLMFVGTRRDNDRLAGFEEAAHEKGHTTTVVDLMSPDVRRATSREPKCSGMIRDECAPLRWEWACTYLDGTAKPAGVYCEDMVWSHAIIEGCVARGIAVPEEVALVATVDDTREGNSWPMPTTVVAPNYELQAYRAAELLDRLMREGRVEADRCERVPPRPIVARRSTLVGGVDNVPVSRAVACIMRFRCSDALSIKNVVRAAGVSRSVLSRDFEKIMGMTMVQYVQRIRLGEATKLLEHSELSATAIAGQCGFTDLRHLTRTLKRATDMTPGAYRAGLRRKKRTLAHAK